MNKKQLSVVLGGALVGSLATSPVAIADGNPFAMSKLSSGYQVASGDHGKMEGKCGGSMMKKNKEGKCGGNKKMGDMKGKKMEGKCGGKMEGMDMKGKKMEGKCGGSMKNMQMEKKAKKEGKCGEGKCGGM